MEREISWAAGFGHWARRPGHVRWGATQRMARNVVECSAAAARAVAVGGGGQESLARVRAFAPCRPERKPDHHPWCAVPINEPLIHPHFIFYIYISTLYLYNKKRASYHRNFIRRFVRHPLPKFFVRQARYTYRIDYPLSWAFDCGALQTAPLRPKRLGLSPRSRTEPG